ncbi:MAG: hypothetical protein JOY93_09985, partial [Acidobacteriales bacterium]|nr:hypothetical protein [Terriglobales bacterium]
RNLSGLGLHLQLAGLAWAQNDDAEMERQIELSKDGPAGEMAVLGFRSGVLAARGQLRQALDVAEKSRVAANRLSLKDVVANSYAQQAMFEAILGDKARAIDDAGRALKGSVSADVVINAAIAMAFARDDQRALKLADDVARQRPYDTRIQAVQLPLIKAQLELNHGKAAAALDLLDGAMVYARAFTTAQYVRGNAYLAAGRASDAVETFQRLLALKASAAVDPLIPLASLGLARAYALAGDKPHSRVAYQDFLASWKDADPDLEFLQHVKQEYEKVKS